MKMLGQPRTALFFMEAISMLNSYRLAFFMTQF